MQERRLLMDNFSSKEINKPGKDSKQGLRDVSFEHFRKENKKLAEKAVKKCEKTDQQKVRDGTHKWVREGKVVRLVKIDKPS